MNVSDYPEFDYSLLGGHPKQVGLSFSAGKDSVACWLQLRSLGVQVIPFYLQLVPGLEFIEQSLRYYEEYFQTHIYRLSHPNFNANLDLFEYQPPQALPIIDWLNIPIFDYADVEEGVRRTVQQPDLWIAVGVKKADSMMRRLRTQPTVPHRKMFHPLIDWTKSHVVEILRANRVKVPIDYKLFGRSFDGLYARYLVPIQEHFPADYERIKQWFPEVDLELTRLEVLKRHG